MRKWLLITTAVVSVSLAPTQASAGPLVGAFAFVGSWWTALGATALGAFTQTLIQIGAGLVLTSLTAPRAPTAQELKFQVPTPTSLPGKRFLYGNFPFPGTPAPWRVNGDFLLGCLILNSRPSAGTNLSITIDGRRTSIRSGDIFDFALDGAVIDVIENFPLSGDSVFIKAWIGLGDQTTCPIGIRTRAPAAFDVADAWTGSTVLWILCSAGSSEEKRVKRWPNGVPKIEVRMDWSKVWDPEDGAQDKDDPDTWTYSDNQARCLLDAIRHNPMRAYTDSQVILEQFADAVPLADEDVDLWFASLDAGETVTEKRYRVSTAIDWSQGELMDLIKPLADAGAGRLTVVGGRLGYISGAYQPPVYTMSDILDDQPISFTLLGSKRDVPFALKGTWTSEENSYEKGELSPILVPGGSGRPDHIEDWALPAVPSGTQCQRVTQIEARRRAAQKRLSCMLPPSAIGLLPGSGVTGACPAPFTRFNIGWQVLDANPGVWLQDGDIGKVAFRVPVTLAEDSPSIYAWVPEENEQAIETEDLVPIPDPLGSVSALIAQTVEINSGGAVILMISFSFDPITGSVVDQYEVAWREDGEMEFIPLPDIPANAIDDSGNVSGRFGPVEFGKSYDLGVRPVGPTSDGPWLYVYDIVAGLAATGLSASLGAAGELVVTGTAPTSGYLGGGRLFQGTVGSDFSDAVQVGVDMPLSSGAAFSLTFTGLSAGAADFWFAPYTSSGTNGTPSALGTYTIT